MKYISNTKAKPTTTMRREPTINDNNHKNQILTREKTYATKTRLKPKNVIVSEKAS